MMSTPKGGKEVSQNADKNVHGKKGADFWKKILRPSFMDDPQSPCWLVHPFGQSINCVFSSTTQDTIELMT